jgi:hypothetical protein
LIHHPLLGPVERYPAPCGCAGPYYNSMCEAHKILDRERQARMMGIGVEVVRATTSGSWRFPEALMIPPNTVLTITGGEFLLLRDDGAILASGKVEEVTT